ncbi:MAG: hypothetical protein U9Q35_01210 [Pseudomonadota bacterium]|nr:hypothetical protein [Pseudomonadota bacterium]
MSDVPIEPRDYSFGVKVVDIGELRIARGQSKRPPSICKHRQMVYDDKERRIYCEDCESDVEPFDAFKGLVEFWDGETKRLKRRRADLEQAETFSLRSRAAKAMDEEWRKRSTVPCCPHCSEALLPEDMVSGKSTASKEWALARRNKKPK